jgi:peptidoglycan/xylan/chitin deacetylase (PgdA/CDA1 family)
LDKMSVLKLSSLLLAGLLLVGCQPDAQHNMNQTNDSVQTVFAAQTAPNLNEPMMTKYEGQLPQQWGEKTTGVAFQLRTDEKVIALTFDACGGSSQSNGYDADLISYLKQMQIPATLFVSGQWIKANQDVFLQLAADPHFEIANHGFRHLPCSITGRSAYGIKGTVNISAVVDEIEANQQLIISLTGTQPHFYRSGTNFYDDIAVKIAKELKVQPVGYSVLGDAGATFTRRQVSQALLTARPGSIVIFHFNHPEGSTAEGIRDAIPGLLSQGFRFVKLSDYDLICFN